MHKPLKELKALFAQAMPEDFSGAAWAKLYILDEGSPFVELHTWPVPGLRKRPTLHSDIKAVKTALLVESWLTMQSLSVLDIRPILPNRDTKTQKSSGTDNRTKDQRRQDAERIIKAIIGQKSWGTAKKQGRQDAKIWYNTDTTMRLNRYMRTTKIKNIRLQNPGISDIAIVQKLLNDITALRMVDIGFEVLSDMTRAMRRIPGTTTKEKKKKYPKDFSVDRLYSIEILQLATYLSGVNLGAHFRCQDYVEYLEALAIIGKIYREVPLTDIEQAFCVSYIRPLLRGERAPSSMSEIAICNRIFPKINDKVSRNRIDGYHFLRDSLSD